MDATSELRQAHRTAALITGALITGLVMYGSRSLALPLANFPRYQAWEAWLSTPAPRP